MTTDQSTPERSDALALPKADKAGWSDIDVRAVDTARLLAADAVQKVGNGHPGTAMSLAPVAYLIYQNLMTYDPTDTEWIGRDRFVLSCGHSSLTQYVQLYLSGSGLELDDLKALRTWGSKTPGHPEVHHTKGVDITAASTLTYVAAQFVGGFIGGWLLPMLGLSVGGGWFGFLVTAFIGAVILLAIVNLFRR